jgi:hypothetical protein
MRKTTSIITAAAVLVLAVAVLAVGDTGKVSTCDKGIETASAASYGQGVCDKSAKTAGCSNMKTAGAAGCPAAKCGRASCCANKARQAHYSQVKELATDIPYRENTRLVIAGTITCGTCDLGKTDRCQPFFETADGNLYPLSKGMPIQAMKKSGSKEFEITSRVKKEGGIKFLDVTSFKTI